MKQLSIFSILAASAMLFSAQQKTPKVDVKKMNKFFNKNYPLVTSGKAMVGKDTVSVQNFIMSSGEITNLNYKEFLADLKKNGKDELYRKCLPDTTQWTKINDNLLPMTTHYFSHAAYRSFPVVNITKENAEEYCKWLSEQFTSRLPEGQTLKFRLPTKAEWLRAACGNEINSPYSWKGPYLRNAQGHYLANFTKVSETSISRNDKGELQFEKEYPFPILNGEGADLVAATKSYFPNEFGIYNMNGNVAELLADSDEVIGGSWYDTGYDIRNQSTKKHNGASPKVGFRVVATITSSNQPWFVPQKK